jgi:hypothetical protein
LAEEVDAAGRKIREVDRRKAATSTPAAAAVLAAEEAIVQRIGACKTYRDWLEVTKMLPADDGGYDIVKALDDNRRWSGERPLLPDEGGGP